jgi:hypothetical protein
VAALLFMAVNLAISRDSAGYEALQMPGGDVLDPVERRLVVGG